MSAIICDIKHIKEEWIIQFKNIFDTAIKKI